MSPNATRQSLVRSVFAKLLQMQKVKQEMSLLTGTQRPFGYIPYTSTPISSSTIITFLHNPNTHRQSSNSHLSLRAS